MSILLVVGLGNPGREYDGTRHNAGFAVLDALVRPLGLAWQHSRRFEADLARWDAAPGRTVLLVKPQTFMNSSGRAVQALASFHRVPPAATVAVYDDLNLALGLVKVSVTGSAGGHNGVASLLAHLGDGFIRYRIGIGPKEPPEIDLADFVLSRFTPAQQTIFNQHLDHYLTGLRHVLDDGADRAMNLLNRRPTAQ
ncbi:MAG: aminoacyl-tRNA hydrolase [Verrucomicrobiota bacterium]